MLYTFINLGGDWGGEKEKKKKEEKKKEFSTRDFIINRVPSSPSPPSITVHNNLQIDHGATPNTFLAVIGTNRV